MGILDQYGGAISSIESGGNYSALGPVTRGDQAMGRYQIMGKNIGPWSREILGREVTPKEFVANPQLQDAIFKGKFGQYVQKYGPEGAAKAWFAGEKGMNNPNAKDVLGTSVSQYASKFGKALGQPSGAPIPAPSAATPPTASAAPPPGILAPPEETKPEGGMKSLMAGLLQQSMQPQQAPQMQLAPPQRGQSQFPDLGKYIAQYMQTLNGST